MNAPYVDNSNKWAGGGISSTAADVAKFGYAMLQFKLISRETTLQMWKHQRTNSGEKVPYGIGWQLKDLSDSGDAAESSAGIPEIIYHGGGAVGGSSMLILLPASGMVVAVVCNLQDLKLFDVALSLSHIFETISTYIALNK